MKSVMTNETEAPERIWVCAHLGEYGHYYPEAVEAEGEWGGVAVPYVPETISDAQAARIAELEAEVETLRYMLPVKVGGFSAALVKKGQTQ